MFNIFRRGSKKKTNNKINKQQNQQQNEEKNDHKHSKFEKIECSGAGNDDASASSRNETIDERSTVTDDQKQKQKEHQHQKEQQLFEFPATTTIDYVSLPIESISKKSNQKKKDQHFSEIETNDSYASSTSKPNRSNFRDFFNDLIMAKGRHRNRHQQNNSNYFHHQNQKKNHNNNNNSCKSVDKHGYQITDSKNSEKKNLEEKKVACEESARALISERCENGENFENNVEEAEREQSNGNSCEDTECSEEKNRENLSELTECDRDTVMGQTNGKTTPTQASSTMPPSRSSSPYVREFRESKIDGAAVTDSTNSTNVTNSNKTNDIVIPKITVEDFSKDADKVHKEQEPLNAHKEPECDDSSEESEEEEEEEEDEEEESEDDEDEAADHITPLVKSENSSDSNLSSPDSGYVGSTQNPSANSHHPQFIRDGSSTDCEEHLIHDDFVSGNNGGSDEILIESISLPDVVVDVEASQNNNHLNSCDNYLINSASGKSDEKSVHFIPIKVEKRGSVDDSVVNEKANGYYTLNHNHRRSSNGVVITAEEDELEISHQKCLEEKKFVFFHFIFVFLYI